MDLLSRGDAGGRERAAAARPAGAAPRAGGRVPLGGRRTRRTAVMTRAAGLIAAGAILLVASYPPFHLPIVSFVALAPAVVLMRQLEREPDARAALRRGFWYGFVTQGAVLYWLVRAPWRFTPPSGLGLPPPTGTYG